MADYTKLIDAETWAFIDKTNGFYPPDASELSIVENRVIYDRMCRAFFAGYPDGVVVEDSIVPQTDHVIPVRLYRSQSGTAQAQVVYFHGGGFVLGGLDSHDDICAELCQRTGFDVTSVDYRLAPEHVHPAAFDDALAAFEWACSRSPLPVVLCGDSAGGNLAAAVSHATRRHQRRPAGQMLIYPGLGGDQTGGSYLTHAHAPMLTAKDIDMYRTIRSGGREVTGDITSAPLADADFSNLPPTVIITAECDPLSSDGEAYASRIHSAGGKAWWFEEPGLVHGYLRGRHSVGRAATSFSRIVDAVSALGRGNWVL
ncbi:alpha/beta hydrolase fold domain-containing protein [Mesorhizobium sp. NBSH29]|uniref:alpha/beta hydrolase n=1 Tax=Mesorhizobium sp. NBSH29 TaxID=2654249 RepID=UPI00189678C0|nr:alpha/beta hydrolase [Mesorhizobium sp. NBSH29]QPC88461.1 alpha/beta hydrolase fold domain-containing protein [Mesorhizobium sp. NBSH29]